VGTLASQVLVIERSYLALRWSWSIVVHLRYGPRQCTNYSIPVCHNSGSQESLAFSRMKESDDDSSSCVAKWMNHETILKHPGVRRSEVRFPLFRPYLVAPPNRSPRQRLYTPSPVKELPKGTGSLRRLPPLDLGGKARNNSRRLGFTAWQKFLGMERTFWTHLCTARAKIFALSFQTPKPATRSVY
jgi:hypothetical protein